MLCPGCFQEKPDAAVCPHCGYDESVKRSPLVLPHHSLLNQGRYRVGKVLGKPGGFGITYLGWDERLQTKVAIKEYLPRELAGRDADHQTVAAHSGEDADAFAFGLGKFLEEARTLAKLDHPNLVRVRDFFEEHGTAYLVMDYYDGLTLAEYLARQPGGKITETQAIGILLPILDGLREVHAKGFLHRDIKPANIYLTAGNRPILLDFGAARQAMGEHSRSLSVVLSEGYAPIEQYQRNGKQGPWTDVYGAAATLYTMLTGQVPPSAPDRLGNDAAGMDALTAISPVVKSLIEKALSINPAQRVQTVEAWQGHLVGASHPESFPSIKRETNAALNKPMLNQINLQRWIIGFGLLLVIFMLVFKQLKPIREGSNLSVTSVVEPIGSTPYSVPIEKDDRKYYEHSLPQEKGHNEQVILGRCRMGYCYWMKIIEQREIKRSRTAVLYRLTTQGAAKDYPNDEYPTQPPLAATLDWGEELAIVYIFCSNHLPAALRLNKNTRLYEAMVPLLERNGEASSGAAESDSSLYYYACHGITDPLKRSGYTFDLWPEYHGYNTQNFSFVDPVDIFRYVKP